MAQRTLPARRYFGAFLLVVAVLYGLVFLTGDTRTPRGRVATEAAWQHLGQPLPRGGVPLGRVTADPQATGSSSETLFDA